MFTRQHYKAVAEMIRVAVDKDELVDKLCVWFKEDNGRFQEDKFRDAVYKVKDK